MQAVARFSLFEVQIFGTPISAGADVSFPIVTAPGGQGGVSIAENAQSHEFLATLCG
jgi:hypothetical protein